MENHDYGPWLANADCAPCNGPALEILENGFPVEENRQNGFLLVDSDNGSFLKIPLAYSVEKDQGSSSALENLEEFFVDENPKSVFLLGISGMNSDWEPSAQSYLSESQIYL